MVEEIITMNSVTKQQAEARLVQVQAQLYGLMKQVEQLENEARSIAGFINISNQEEYELAAAEEQQGLHLVDNK
jgi:hypothetical protein